MDIISNLDQNWYERFDPRLRGAHGAVERPGAEERNHLQHLPLGTRCRKEKEGREIDRYGEKEGVRQGGGAVSEWDGNVINPKQHLRGHGPLHERAHLPT